MNGLISKKRHSIIRVPHSEDRDLLKNRVASRVYLHLIAEDDTRSK